MKRVIIAMVLAVFGLSAAPPASAGEVQVTLQVAFGLHSAGPLLADCAIQVAEGADGVSVLDAAADAACIDGYKLTVGQFGAFITCITPKGRPELCGTTNGVSPSSDSLFTSWVFFYNGSQSDTGVSGKSAHAGDRFGFTYSTIACFFVC